MPRGRPKKKKPTEEEKVTPAESDVSVAEPKEESPKPAPTSSEPDPFDAFVAAAKERWPGSVEKASNLPVDGTPAMSTGNFGLDVATYGGLRRGRLYRFWGRPKSAKTGSALNAVEAFTNNHCAACFEHRLTCQCNFPEFRYAKALFIDVEGRVSDNRPWAEAHGIDPSRLAFVAPSGGEQVVDIADCALRSDAGIGLVVIDSLAQMSSAAEVGKAAEKGQTIGRNALLINSALRKWVCSLCSKDISSTRKPTVIMINQIRNKTDSFGSPDVMPGGLGQGFASACDIKFTHRQYHYLVEKNGKFEDKVVKFGDTGFRPSEDATPDFVEIEYKVTESGICPRGRYGSFNYWLRPGHGRRAGDPDNLSKVWAYAKRYKLLQKEGSTYRLGNLQAKTQKEMEAKLADDPDAQDQLWFELLEILKNT